MKYNTFNIVAVCEKFEYESQTFKEYFEVNEQKIQDRNRELLLLKEEDVNQNSEQAYIYEQIYSFDLIKIPSFFYHSSIVSQYSILENNLVFLCDRLSSELNLKIFVKDLQGQSLIKKCKFFLEKVMEISACENLWREISNFQWLRNRIVHHNSALVFDTNNEIIENEYFKYLKNNLNIDFNQKVFIVKNRELIDQFWNKIEQLFELIFNEIHQKHYSKFIIEDFFESPFF